MMLPNMKLQSNIKKQAAWLLSAGILLAGIMAFMLPEDPKISIKKG